VPSQETREIRFERSFTRFAEGAVLASMGDTRVLCTATVLEEVPRFLKGTGKGWITAEYAMLPRSTKERTPRESVKGRQAGRSMEIQRLIGRSLRSVLLPEILGERQILLDCDVLQADGGTRTCAINGAYVAVVDAVKTLTEKGIVKTYPLKEAVAAVSVGIVGGKPLLDLCYEEDSSAEVDFNVVMTESGRFVEIQGTAEHEPFDDAMLASMLELARKGVGQVLEAQKKSLKA